MNLTQIRRHNLLTLIRQHEERQVAAGNSAGLAGSFAALLGVHISLVSHLKSARPISDKLARQFEATLQLESGWMDLAHEETPAPTDAERHYLDLCLQAYRATSAKGRRELMKRAQAHLDSMKKA